MRGYLQFGMGMMLSLAAMNVAEAKVLHKYEGLLQVKNNLGQFSDFQTHLVFGWSCSSSVQARVTEIQADHKGRDQRMTWDSKYDTSFNTLWSGQPSIRGEFYINFGHKEPRYEVTVRESCSKTDYENKTVTDYDSKGNRTGSHTERVPVYRSAYLDWSCNFTRFPMNKGQTLVQDCQAKQSSLSSLANVFSNGMDGAILSYMKEKTITLTTRLTEVKAKLLDYNCDGKTENAMILNLSQGVDGYAAENDFVFSIRVNGGKWLKREESKGLLNADLAYCARAGEKDLHVEITAYEDDPDWYLNGDDKYAPENSLHLTIGQGGTKDGFITLKRSDTWLEAIGGNAVRGWFLDAISKVRVKLIN